MGSLTESASVLLNGVAAGMILFMIAVGLSVIFGLMDVLNLAHGAVFLTGSYLGYRIAGETLATWGSFGLALVAAAGVGALLGVLLMAMLRPLAGRGHMDQALLTLGLALVISELLLEVFGRDDHAVAAPGVLAESTDALGFTYPLYRLALIAFGGLTAAALWYGLERTPFGAVVRATVADSQMVEAVGIDVGRVRAFTFVLATSLAVVGGVLAGPVKGASAGLDDETLLLALVVVVIGGLGSIIGTLVSALLVGLVQNVGVVLLPELAPFLLFGAMVLIMVLRPQGLFPSLAGASR